MLQTQQGLLFAELKRKDLHPNGKTPCTWMAHHRRSIRQHVDEPAADARPQGNAMLLTNCALVSLIGLACFKKVSDKSTAWMVSVDTGR